MKATFTVSGTEMQAYCNEKVYGPSEKMYIQICNLNSFAKKPSFKTEGTYSRKTGRLETLGQGTMTVLQSAAQALGLIEER